MESLEERVARLEEQVAHLQRLLGADSRGGAVQASAGGAVQARGPRLPPEFYDALRGGKTVTAIKIYRQATGASLLDAKRAVEMMAREARG
ncbi:hypothetical protein ABGB18_39515 [Nonomuraea sp. B12E4]|uniref:hypothetical protein n=1 Tax=Nonomuraea sp. B12E4 TaxID=3153564 RepID=UPI00325CC9C2